MNRFVYRYCLGYVIFPFAVIFIFEPQIDHVMSFIGYNESMASYFPFIRQMYTRIVSAIGHVDVVYFHIIDISIVLSIGVWGVWLTAGVVFLREYDDYFGALSRSLSADSRSNRVLFWGGLLAMVFAPLSVTFVSVQPEMLRDREIALLITKAPRLYFFAFFMVYYYFGVAFDVIILFSLWRWLRQRRRSVNLWHEGMEGGGTP